MGEDERLSRVGAVYQACRITDQLFAMNPFLTQQNFYSQQLRALALVEAIAEVGLTVGKRNVIVVGAGIAGRTLAAGFAAVGASVILVEARERQFERYRTAVHRELHPNIIFWPYQEPVPATALPFLNWAQAPATEVVTDLMKEWEDSFGHKINVRREEVTAIQQVAHGVEIDTKSGGKLKGDLCVLAMGFKNERTFGTLKSPSYWSPNAVADEDNAVLVSGSGDGGLIDVLSPILGTDVTRAAHSLAIALGDSPLKQDIAKVEDDRLARKIDGTRDSHDHCQFYEKVQVPPDAAQKVEALSQSQEKLFGRSITFLYESTSPYSFTAAPINKLLLAHFCNGSMPLITAVRGSLKQDGKGHRMECQDGKGEALDPPCRFDKIMVRHGADPAISDVLNPDQIELLKRQAESYPEAAMVEDYNRDLYRWHQAGMGKSGVRLEAMPQAFRRALQHISRAYELDIKVGAISTDNFFGDRPIKVDLPANDRRKAEELKLFPLRVGPATVKLGRPLISRNAPYDQPA